MALNKIAIIGLGYIGLPTAAVFASKNLQVIGVDIDQERVKIINNGKIPFVEPELESIVSATIKSGFLKATHTPEEADAFLITVPTPFKVSKYSLHKPDLKFIKSAAFAIAPLLKKGDLVVLESTSPVGTTEKLKKWLQSKRNDLIFPSSTSSDPDINIAYCPERVMPGQVIRELQENDRVVGGISKRCSLKAASLYKMITIGNCHITNSRTAEMTKLTENACRDVQIAFANELSMICDELNINVWDLIGLANKHPRINILNPGPGVGGHCIAVDPWFIVSKSPKNSKIIKTAREINLFKAEWVLMKLKQEINDFLSKNKELTNDDITVACLGLSFKPNIDDLRESPALEIALNISNEYSIRPLVVEPNIKSLPEKYNSSLQLESLDIAIKKSNIILILVKHSDFLGLDVTGLENKIILDTVGIIKNTLFMGD